MQVYKFKYNGKTKTFMYNKEKALVMLVTKATKEEIQDNIEWNEKYNRNLWRIEEGYVIVHSVGLSNENWKNKESRDEYLFEYCYQLDEELKYLM